MSINENADVILLTPEGFNRLTAEFEHLTTERRPEIAERLRDSKDHGEFSDDNSELDEVKFEQAMVEGRIVDLKSVLLNAQVLTPDDVSNREVTIGTIAEIVNTKMKKKRKVTLVSSVEADPANELISVESPLGEALIGNKKGDKVTVDAPAGKIVWEIRALSKGVK
ncbi:MAG: transcription elongation factor GreA [Armatimonadota bacterium]|nr:transcription elongation factor GreA [Armatimonadota bacterium]